MILQIVNTPAELMVGLKWWNKEDTVHLSDHIFLISLTYGSWNVVFLYSYSLSLSISPHSYSESNTFDKNRDKTNRVWNWLVALFLFFLFRFSYCEFIWLQLSCGENSFNSQQMSSLYSMDIIIRVVCLAPTPPPSRLSQLIIMVTVINIDRTRCGHKNSLVRFRKRWYGLKKTTLTISLKQDMYCCLLFQSFVTRSHQCWWLCDQTWRDVEPLVVLAADSLMIYLCLGNYRVCTLCWQLSFDWSVHFYSHIFTALFAWNTFIFLCAEECLCCHVGMQQFAGKKNKHLWHIGSFTSQVFEDDAFCIHLHNQMSEEDQRPQNVSSRDGEVLPPWSININLEEEENSEAHWSQQDVSSGEDEHLQEIEQQLIQYFLDVLWTNTSILTVKLNTRTTRKTTS